MSIPEQKAPPIDEATLPAILKDHKILPDEYKKVKEILERVPTLAELGVFSAMWSEHCSYKSSRKHLAKLPTKGDHIVVGPGENAGVVRLKDNICIAFKMESHNHPSYIEPYHGAATGVGGIMRDVFCMGARPIANLNCLRFGKKSHPKTARLLEQSVKGIGHYGNCVGVPTVGGSVSFDESYDGNCLVNAMTVGLIDEDKIFKGYASGIGNYVLYVGSATGRDGIHGATMASESFTENSGESKNTIQVGDPYMENLLMEATLEVLEKGLVVGLQDMGAAGLTSSAFEMADRAGNGLLLDFDKIPVRTTSKMTAYELLLSESQERMLMVVEPDKWLELQVILQKWGLAFAVIGEVTDTGRVQIHYEDIMEVDLPVAPLTDNAPKYDRPTKANKSDRDFEYKKMVTTKMQGSTDTEIICAMLSHSGSKKNTYTQYDHHIGARTVCGPDSQGAGVLRIQNDSLDEGCDFLGVSVAASSFEDVGKSNNRIGAEYSVLKTARMIVASGGKPLAVTDCLNFGNPEDPKVMHEFVESIEGIKEACLQLNTPVVSGNVSLYNETSGQSILPTPMIGMVGKVDDVRLAKPAVVTRPCKLFLLSPKDIDPTFAGSLAAKSFDHEKHYLNTTVKPIDWNLEQDAFEILSTLRPEKSILAVRDISASGLIVTALKMILDTPLLGLHLKLEEPYCELGYGMLSSSYLIACESSADSLQSLESAVIDSPFSLKEVATIAADSSISVNGKKVDYTEVQKSYASFDVPEV